MEGWYDSNIWCHFIDSLLQNSKVLSILRKEISIIPRGNSDRYDGVFRYIDGIHRFDVGLIEVGRLPNHPNSDPKPSNDREKILHGLSLLLASAQKATPHLELQVIGILCTGTQIWFGFVTLPNNRRLDHYYLSYGISPRLRQICCQRSQVRPSYGSLLSPQKPRNL